jgi:hypothetical protein
MYYFINWVHPTDGYRPALLEDIAFAMLAEPSEAFKGAIFALFECELPENFLVSEKVEPVPDHPAELLDSAKSYPPTLALTRFQVSKQPRHSKQDFTEALVQRLRFHLNGQRAAPFFLATVRVTELGYKEAGGYYWIVGYVGRFDPSTR